MCEFRIPGVFSVDITPRHDPSQALFDQALLALRGIDDLEFRKAATEGICAAKLQGELDRMEGRLRDDAIGRGFLTTRFVELMNYNEVLGTHAAGGLYEKLLKSFENAARMSPHVSPRDLIDVFARVASVMMTSPHLNEGDQNAAS